MDNLKRIIELANEFIENTKPIQTEYYEDFVDDFPCHVFNESIDVAQVWVSQVDEHRWYGLQDLVFKFELNGDVEYVKTTLVTQSYSESQDIEDIYHSYPKFKIVYPKEVKTIIYE